MGWENRTGAAGLYKSAKKTKAVKLTQPKQVEGLYSGFGFKSIKNKGQLSTISSSVDAHIAKKKLKLQVNSATTVCFGSIKTNEYAFVYIGGKWFAFLWKADGDRKNSASSARDEKEDSVNTDNQVTLARQETVESVPAGVAQIEINDGSDDGTVYTYLGILNTLIPPALGGDPEKGREHFERAIEISGGTDLSAKVEYANGYARLLYERELHDRLLNEVLAADPNVPGATLPNVLAQEQAAELLASADDYF